MNSSAGTAVRFDIHRPRGFTKVWGEFAMGPRVPGSNPDGS